MYTCNKDIIVFTLVELPDGHVVVEDRAGSCHGQRVRHQTRGTDAAHSALHVRAPRGGTADNDMFN